MKLLFPVTTILASTLILSCGRQAKMERCKFVEIETPEFEVEIGDVDIEGGEVEMACGDKLVDVPWNQFNSKLRINPKKYLNNLYGFERKVSCAINERSKKQVVFCSLANNNKSKALKFNLDD